MPDTPNSNDSNKMPSELEAIHRRLLADSARWNVNVPSTASLEARLHRLTNDRSVAFREVVSERYDPSVDTHPPIVSSRITSRPSRRTVAAAFVTAAGLVAVFALILHALAGVSYVARPGATPTATLATLRYLGARGSWVSGASFGAGQDRTVVAVAPSDPLVMYRWPPSGGPAIQRSGNGGKTWTDYSVSTIQAGDTIGAITLTVSPLNEDTVFALLISGPSNPNCPRPAVGASSSFRNSGDRTPLSSLIHTAGGYSCVFGYASIDGGKTWQREQTPEPGYASFGSSGQSPVTQDGRIFSLLGVQLNGPASVGHRLISSRDGIHWQYADATLAAHRQAAVEFVAAPGATTLYATTVSMNAVDGDALANRSLWRSDDSGATWRLLGMFPNGDTPSTGSDLSAAVRLGGDMFIYETAWQPPSSAPPELPGAIPLIRVSKDDGRTWMDAPTTGLPSGRVVIGTVPVGVLPDGMTVWPFVHVTEVAAGGNSLSIEISDLAYYGWKPSDGVWTQLTPTIKGSVGYDLPMWLTQPVGDNPASVWAEVFDGNHVKLLNCRLTS